MNMISITFSPVLGVSCLQSFKHITSFVQVATAFFFPFPLPLLARYFSKPLRAGIQTNVYTLGLELLKEVLDGLMVEVEVVALV